MNEEQGPVNASPRAALRYAAVAAISLSLGVGGTYLVFGRRQAAPQPASGASQPAGGEHAGMPGMEGVKEGEKKEKSVFISPERQQLIGVRTAPIGTQELAATIRTVGTLAYDETRLTQVHTRISGWVDRVYVDYVGRAVRKDEPLFTIYSPDLLSTENEYLLAMRAKAEMGESAIPATRAATDRLLTAAKQRLELWGIPAEHIAELEKTGKATRTLMLHAPFDGVVLERSAFPGQYLTPEMTAFKVADLSRIWALGSIFEYELSLIRLGQEAEIQFPYGQSTQTLKGKVTYIAPEIDPQTRRVKIRVELPNPGSRLKPETYVTIVLSTGGGRVLAIPKEAVIDTGAKRYAILAHEDGTFEPRDIQVGQPGDEYYPLLGGLKEGDRIAVSAQFLIDSETNLQAAMQAMAGMPGMDMGQGKGSEKPSSPAPKGAPAMPGMDMGSDKKGEKPGHEGHQK